MRVGDFILTCAMVWLRLRFAWVDVKFSNLLLYPFYSPIFFHLCTMTSNIPLITVLGPTAVGKTSFGARLAVELDAEIISADSRQVFKGMDIGTGKDLADYRVGEKNVPHHLIDIAEPGSEYNVYRFKHDFLEAWQAIHSRNKLPVLCGGTGMYLESVLLDYDLVEVPENVALREKLAGLPDAELIRMISTARQLHNTTDTSDRERLIRALEIEIFKQDHDNLIKRPDFSNTPVFGIRFDREIIRNRITQRLYQRLNEGMIDEVKQLMENGVSADRLLFYGLEYKYITLHLKGELSYSQMVNLLNTAIHQFAKRQMTWFRRMEKKGVRIYWLEGENGLEANIDKALLYIKNFDA